MEIYESKKRLETLKMEEMAEKKKGNENERIGQETGRKGNKN